jgi:hypothetical protein
MSLSVYERRGAVDAGQAIEVGERSPRGIGNPFGIIEREVVVVHLDREHDLVRASGRHREIIARAGNRLERGWPAPVRRAAVSSQERSR